MLIMVVEFLKEIGLVLLNIKDNKLFQVNHSINGVFQVYILYKYLDGSMTDYYYSTKSA
jgi:hypothetical protein